MLNIYFIPILKLYKKYKEILELYLNYNYAFNALRYFCYHYNILNFKKNKEELC